MSQIEGRYYEFSFSLPRADRVKLVTAIKAAVEPETIAAYFADEAVTVVVPDTMRLSENVSAESLARQWFEVAKVGWVAPHQIVIIDGPAMEAHVQRVRGDQRRQQVYLSAGVA